MNDYELPTQQAAGFPTSKIRLYSERLPIGPTVAGYKKLRYVLVIDTTDLTSQISRKLGFV